MSRVTESVLVRARSGRPGDWQVWLRPPSGLPRSVCAQWTRRSLALAPAEFLALHPWPRSKASARRIGQALVDYLKAHSAAPASGPSVLDYARLFECAATSPRAAALAAEGRPYEAATLANYKDKIERYVVTDAEFSELRMGEVAQADVVAYLARTLGKMGGVSCRSYQDLWVILHMIFNQYAEDNEVPSPFHSPKRLHKPKYAEQIRGALSEAELRRIFEEVGFPDPLERAACCLAFWAGLRRGEVFALRWSDVDFENHRLVISRAMKQFAYKAKSEGGTKGKKARVVPMVSYVEESLKDLAGAGDYVIQNPDGTRPGARWWADTVGGAFARANINARARAITPHSSRHSIASVLLARGVPKSDIQSILGHFDERTTDGYLHQAVDAVEKMRNRMEG